MPLEDDNATERYHREINPYVDVTVSVVYGYILSLDEVITPVWRLVLLVDITETV